VDTTALGSLPVKRPSSNLVAVWMSQGKEHAPVEKRIVCIVLIAQPDGRLSPGRCEETP